LANLTRALHLYLEDDRDPGGDAALELGAQRPVAIARVRRVLDEVARGDAVLELARGEEVIRDPVPLARPRWPGRRRDRQLERRDPVEQRPDQGALADAGGAGDHEHL